MLQTGQLGAQDLYTPVVKANFCVLFLYGFMVVYEIFWVLIITLVNKILAHERFIVFLT